MPAIPPSAGGQSGSVVVRVRVPEAVQRPAPTPGPSPPPEPATAPSSETPKKPPAGNPGPVFILPG